MNYIEILARAQSVPDVFADAELAKLFALANAEREKIYGRGVFIRGLIEFSSYCANDCHYCGLRRSNGQAERYRLSESQILECCALGHKLGFRTFVLQSGEQRGASHRDELVDTVTAIRKAYPDCAITLSVGELEDGEYAALKDAGADRYLLRHETANAEHYAKLHPPEMSRENRIRCLNTLKKLGYQVGCGFMVGSPYQTLENLAEDLEFVRDFKPQMVGVGPFIPHSQTPFADEPHDTQRKLNLTLALIALLRLTDPKLLIPSTTALGTIHPRGRELGILAGANVVMPNLSPQGVRGKYLLYDGKICTGDEAAECVRCMKRRMEGIGYTILTERGDYAD